MVMKYIYYDMDHGSGYRISTTIQYLCNPTEQDGLITHMIMLTKRVIQNSEFRALWFERLAYHLNNSLSKETLTTQFEYLKRLYKDDIARDREMENSYDHLARANPSMNLYNAQLKIIENFIASRQRIVLKQTKTSH